MSLISVPENFKSGYVALVGKPNAGKSTLLNALIGRKLSIVTRKPQTTRHRILGILSGDDHQIILLDTPGMLAPRYKLQEVMMRSVDRALTDADLTVLIVDATDRRVAMPVLSRLEERPVLLVLNKMDLLPAEEVLPLVDAYSKAHHFESVIPISAKTGKQLDVLMEEILKRIPHGPPYYPPEMVSEHPERFFVAEIIREKIFERYRDEIPYSTAVNIISFEEREGEKDFIDAEIVVERDSQKGILIGKRGAALKSVGISARADIEDFIGKSVFLQLHVKVRDDWRNKDNFLQSYGYES